MKLYFIAILQLICNCYNLLASAKLSHIQITNWLKEFSTTNFIFVLFGNHSESGIKHIELTAIPSTIVTNRHLLSTSQSVEEIETFKSLRYKARKHKFVFHFMIVYWFKEQILP